MKEENIMKVGKNGNERGRDFEK